MTVALPPKGLTGGLTSSVVAVAAVALPRQSLTGGVTTSNMLAATVVLPTRIVPSVSSVTGAGGALGGGTAPATSGGNFYFSAAGGAFGGGAADLPRSESFWAVGGGEVLGSAEVAYITPPPAHGIRLSGLIARGAIPAQHGIRLVGLISSARPGMVFAAGGAVGSGTAQYGTSSGSEFAHVSEGGARGGGGVAHSSFGFGADGGALGGGAAIVPTYISLTVVAVGGAVGAGVALAAYERINAIVAALPVVKAAANASTDTISTALPVITASLVVADITSAWVSASLVPVSASLTGGVYSITAALPTITSVVTASAGGDSSISVTLPVLGTNITGLPGVIGTIGATLPLSTATATGVTGLISSINASLTRPAAYADGYVGTAGIITGALLPSVSTINAGFGAVGTISAKLPRSAARLNVMTTLLTQQAIHSVLVINTRTNALSTYEQYPFNSFCELGGTYYGAGPGGLCRLDVGDSDMGFPISAGVGTGLLSFKEPRQKRMTDAYVTLRTAGGLVLTITVDEAATYPAVALTIPAQARTEYVQRRVAIPKGLRGKSWQFELNNVAGADFDFGQLGLNVAPCARRI